MDPVHVQPGRHTPHAHATAYFRMSARRFVDYTGPRPAAGTGPTACRPLGRRPKLRPQHRRPSAATTQPAPSRDFRILTFDHLRATALDAYEARVLRLPSGIVQFTVRSPYVQRPVSGITGAFSGLTFIKSL